MESFSSPLRSRIVKLVNFGKMPNEKDNERESSITPSLISRLSRTGRWHLNNSAGVVPLENNKQNNASEVEKDDGTNYLQSLISQDHE
ncbi:unnamed protein product, partial [Vitis vinifera]